MVAAISFPVALIFIVWGEDITGKLREEYAEAALALTILCFGQLVNASAGSVAVILNMSGHDKQKLYGVIAARSINLVLSTLLIPVFELVGSAVSFSVSLSIWNIALMYMAKKYRYKYFVGFKRFL
jgi:O-antigen/teichoic acid export membrane protein